MLHRRLTLSIALAFLTASVRLAQAQGYTFRLTGITFDNIYAPDPRDGFKIQPGAQAPQLRVVKQQANGLGGVYVLDVRGGPRCPTSSEQFQFTWRFSSDINQVSTSDAHRRVTFGLQRVGSQGTCVDENPGMRFAAGAPFGQQPGYGPTHYLNPNDPSPAWGNYQGDFEFWVNNDNREGYFKIMLAALQNPIIAFEMAVTYHYQPISTVTTSALQQVLANWVANTRRFGSPVSQFATVPWQPGWTLSYMDYAYSGGRKVRVFIAVRQSDGVHGILYFDPDTRAWNGLNWF
jgi:hypothetical protein